MQLRPRFPESFRKRKRLNFSAVLNKEYFSKNIIQIQMALNKDRILPANYAIKKVKSRVNTGITIKPKQEKKEVIDSVFARKDKTKIPEELEKILEDNIKKFEKQENEYLTLKEDNNKSLLYWHYIKEMNKKKDEKKNFFKKFFENDDKNMINLYSEKIQKMTESMFKINPLLITKEKIDIFFYYLGEFNKYFSNEKKYNYIKKKVIDYLEKIKDFLEYAKIKADNKLDSVGKEIKIQNSKFIKELNGRIKAELKSMKLKNKKKDIQEIKQSQININKTKKTLEQLGQDKHYFDDPVYFDPNFSFKKKYDLKSRNNNFQNNKFNLSPQNLAKEIPTYNPNHTIKMSTVSTGFYNPNNNNKNNNNKNHKIKPETAKNNNDILIDDSNFNFKKIKLRNKFDNKKRTISAFNFPNKIVYKVNRFKSKIEKNKIFNAPENKKNSERNSLSSSYLNNLEKNPTEKINNIRLNLNRKSSLSSLRLNEDESAKNFTDKIKFDKSSEIPIIKKNKIFNEKKTFNLKTQNIFTFKRKNPKANTLFQNAKKKSSKTGSQSNSMTQKDRYSKEFHSSEKSKVQLNSIYDGIKIKPLLNNIELNEIKSYFYQNGKKIRSNLKLMEIILQAKKSLYKYNIEQSIKKITQMNMTSEQNDKLNVVKTINNQIENLDVDYLNSIINIKSKTIYDEN